jgi:hypothetical protein
LRLQDDPATQARFLDLLPEKHAVAAGLKAHLVALAPFPSHPPPSRAFSLFPGLVGYGAARSGAPLDGYAMRLFIGSTGVAEPACRWPRTLSL